MRAGRIRELRTSIQRFVDDHLSVIVLCNRSDVEAAQFALKLADCSTRSSLGHTEQVNSTLAEGPEAKPRPVRRSHTPQNGKDPVCFPLK